MLFIYIDIERGGVEEDGYTENELVAPCRQPIIAANRSRRRRIAGSSDENAEPSTSRIRKKGAKKDGFDLVFDMLQKYNPCPPERITQLNVYSDNKILRKITPIDRNFQKALNVYENGLSTMDLIDFLNMLNDGTPVFAATDGNLDSVYYSRTDSFTLLLNFLNFQFNNDFVPFLKLIFNWMNKNNGKKNAILITGPPSSGKTYFANILMSLSITYGLIINSNKYSSFPFNNCVNKRLLFWDEPNFQPSLLEHIKILFAGTKLDVDVKFMKAQRVNKTPILICANRDVFPTNDQFTCRMERLRFKNCPMLVNYKKDLHPMVIYDFFKYFKLI